MKNTSLAGVIALFLILGTFVPGIAHAQSSGEIAPSPSIRRSIATLRTGSDSVSVRKPFGALQATGSGRQRSTARKVAGLAIGAVGGFYGGAYLGAFIEGDRCECDDPGLLGAPIGGVIGAIVGFKYF